MERLNPPILALLGSADNWKMILYAYEETGFGNNFCDPPDFYSNEKNCRILCELRDHKLIRFDPQTYQFAFTEQGRLVVERLAEIEMILSFGLENCLLLDTPDACQELDFLIMLPQRLRRTWESDWIGTHGTSIQQEHKEVIRQYIFQNEIVKKRFGNLFYRRFPFENHHYDVLEKSMQDSYDIETIKKEL